MTFRGINWEEEFPVALEFGQQGKTLQEIGQHYGVSRQRIKQVFKQRGIDPADVGVRIRTRRNNQQKAFDHYAKWGKKEDTDLYAAQRSKFYAKKHNAKRIGWEWGIEYGDIDWPTHCPILGAKLDYFAEYRKEESPSFDRLDTSKGYVKDNVIVLSWRANRIKNDGTAEEHRKIADFLDTIK